jgi:RNA polymerase sigma-70 factor (ECF subfamily)
MAESTRPAEPDPTDLMAVVAHYQSPLLRYVGHLLGQVNHESAEDIVQETFIRLHRQVQRRGANSIANLSTWLFRVAHNRTLDILRHNARRKPKEQATVEAAAQAATDEFDALGEVLREEARQVALAALAQLDDDQRQVVLLKVIQGLTFRQIADILDVSLSAVNYRLQQGLTQLARRLKRAGVV